MRLRRTRRGVLVVLLALLTLAAGRPGQATAARADASLAQVQYLQEQGQARSYLLALGSPSATPRPLLVLFHGVDESSADFLDDTAILAAAQRAGVIVVAPESPDNTWNDGRFGPGGRDDAGFSMAIIDNLVAAGLVDPTRVTVAGFSNGAGMAMLLAADYPQRIAAFVSVDGELLDGPGQVLPTGRVPAFFIHGTGDFVQPLGGRTAGPLLPAQISEQQTIAVFRTANGVGSVKPSISVLPRGPRSSAGPVTVYRWTGHGGTPVAYALINGLGHKWPALACGASRRAATASFIRARLPLALSAGCITQGNQNVKVVDLSANALVLGVTGTAVLGVPSL